MKCFDLNIKEILSNWTCVHAIREIIANALDEQKLSNTKEIKIFCDWKGRWYIRDFGRGIQIHHFTQDENQEKLTSENLIGKFGVGLKDALAIFNKYQINLVIRSKYGEYKLLMQNKNDFQNIETLHVQYFEAKDLNFVGTEFIFENIDTQIIEDAKEKFLNFVSENVLLDTKYGQIIERKVDENAKIYLNGLLFNEEENFLFSYNITKLDKKIKDKINREKNNISRNAYSSRVKKIFKMIKDEEEIIEKIYENLKKNSDGEMSDEVLWKDLYLHSIKIVSKQKNIAVVSNDDFSDNEIVDEMENHYDEVITFPNNLKNDLSELQNNHQELNTYSSFLEKKYENYEYHFIDPKNFEAIAKQNYLLTEKIIALFSGWPSNLKEIKIAEKMQKDTQTFSEAFGLWVPSKQIIIIRYDQLFSLSKYAGTLLHELTHCKTGTSDNTIQFELQLTKLLGEISTKIILKKE